MSSLKVSMPAGIGVKFLRPALAAPWRIPAFFDQYMALYQKNSALPTGKRGRIQKMPGGGCVPPQNMVN
jgi:predicted PilT family ATPase